MIFVFLYCKARTYVEQPDCSGVSQESGAIEEKVGISARSYNSRESSTQKISCPVNLKLPCSGRGQLGGRRMPPHPRDFGHSWAMASQECAGRFLGERNWSSNLAVSIAATGEIIFLKIIIVF